jgi:endonuclease/exonuclease/phosphatase family metal-dependent hydrolase/uncharacterized membrane protein
MNESGTEAIARAVNANYVYYPASSSPSGRNMGNAILSHFPLRDPRKIIMPGLFYANSQSRIAVRATIEMASSDGSVLPVRVYSAHTEIYTATRAHRDAQVAAIVNDVGLGNSPVIVAGDFNTVSRRSIQRLTAQFDAIGLRRITAHAGPTVAKLGGKPTAADHVFVRGFRKLAVGIITEANASDHFPVWVELTADFTIPRQSLFVLQFEGRATADDVYRELRALDKEGLLEIKTAATISRSSSGRLRLRHKRRLNVWQGALGGAALGLLLIGSGGGMAVVALVGALLGAAGAEQRRQVRGFLDDKLGPDQSALAIVISHADWASVQERVTPRGGALLSVELSAEAEAQLAAIKGDLAMVDEATRALAGSVEMDVEDEAGPGE